MPWLIGGAALALYLFTLCPAVYVGDSGELTAAAATLGIAHPPGYPLYVLIGRLFSLLPFGSVAVRLNAMSAFFGAAAAALLSLLVLELLREGDPGGPDGDGGKGPKDRWVVAVVSAAAFAFARSVWSEGVKAEVYTLHLFAIALLVLLSARRAGAGLVFFVLGVAAANHQTVLLLVPGLAYLYFARGERGLRALAVPAAAFAGGASLYLFLLVRPDSPAILAWRKPEGLAGLAGHVLRAQYGELSELPRGLLLAVDQVAFLVRLLAREMILLVLLLPVGLYRALGPGQGALRRSVAIHFLFFSFGLLFLLNHGTDPRDASVAAVYYLPAVLLGIAVAAPVLFGLARRLETARPRLSLALLLAAAVPLLWNARASSARGFTLADEAGRAALDAVPQGSALITEGDNDTFILYYLQIVEKMRPDVELLDRDLNLRPERFALAPGERVDAAARDEAIERLVASGSRPVSSIVRFADRPIAGRRLAAIGPVYRFLPEGEPALPSEIERYHPGGFGEKGMRDDYMARRFAVGYLFRWIDHYRETGNREGLAGLEERLFALGRDLRETHLAAAEAGIAAGDTARALGELERALAVDPGYVEARRRFADLLRASGSLDRAAAEYAEAAKRTGEAGDWLNLGNALALTGMREDAALAYRRADDGSEGDTLVLAGVARGFGLLGLPAEQAAALEAIRASGPGFRDFEQLGDAYALLGRNRESLGAYEEAARADPSSALLAYKLGVALLRDGRSAEAERELERAVRSDPAFGDALNALAYLRAESGARLEEALDLVDRALASGRAADVGYYHDTRGTILARLGRSGEAEEAFRLSIETARPGDRLSLAETCDHLAEVVAARGGSVEAGRLRARADSLRAAPDEPAALHAGHAEASGT